MGSLAPSSIVHLSRVHGIVKNAGIADFEDGVGCRRKRSLA